MSRASRSRAAQKMRFAIGVNGIAHSTVWTATALRGKNDVYITCDHLRHLVKVSVHESGVRYLSFLDAPAAEPGAGRAHGTPRTIAKWDVPRLVANPEVLFEIWTFASELRTAVSGTDGAGDLVLIAPPTSGDAVRISCALVPYGMNLQYLGAGHRRVAGFRLPNRTEFLLTAREMTAPGHIAGLLWSERRRFEKDGVALSEAGRGGRDFVCGFDGERGIFVELAPDSPVPAPHPAVAVPAGTVIPVASHDTPGNPDYSLLSALSEAPGRRRIEPPTQNVSDPIGRWRAFVDGARGSHNHGYLTLEEGPSALEWDGLPAFVLCELTRAGEVLVAVNKAVLFFGTWYPRHEKSLIRSKHAYALPQFPSTRT